MQSLSFEAIQSAVLRGCPSGFLGNEASTQRDFVTNPAWSNFFELGAQASGEQASILWANVNGWLIPVSGTRTGRPPGSPNDTKTSNIVVLDPPPGSAGDNRIDFVWLEVWQARVQASPSTTNKPSASGIYRFGNVETGFSYLADDLQDPAFGFDTTQRVQLQYRIRVTKGLVGFTSNPDGFDPVTVKAQGAASSVTSYTFSNMRSVLGDPGLWRAGDGTENALGTVDGYVYAIPIAAVFRRNSVAWNGNPSHNLNGGFNRNPTATDRSGILGQTSLKLFTTTPTLVSALTASATSLTLVSATNIPMPVSPSTAVMIQIGDEIMTYSSISGTTVNGLVRAQQGTVAEAHPAGSIIKVLSSRPDGLYSDQISHSDIMDLRHVVNPNGMDYDALLRGNLDRLLRGRLRANWKRSGTQPQGTFVHYQDALTSGAISLGVTQLDAPDNVREIFSDAACVQPIECVVRPNGSPFNSPAGVNIQDSTWSLGVPVKTTFQQAGGAFTANDVIVIPVAGLKGGLQAGSTDQVRWLNDGLAGTAVRLRFEGETGDLPTSMYTVTPAVPTPNDDLIITLNSPAFPTQTDQPGILPKLLHITVHAVYGSGRGLSRRADSIHSISYYNPVDTLLVQPAAVPTDNHGSHVSWAPLWSKYRGAINPSTRLPVDVRPRQLPSTAEMYADLGSKTVVVSPFRTINYHEMVTIDGNAANPISTPVASLSGTTSGVNNSLLNVPNTTGTVVGQALVISSGVGQGRYTVIAFVSNTSITVDRPILAQSGQAVSFTLHTAQGLMPLLKRDGVTAKWSQTDPLKMFSQTTTDGTNPAASKNIYIALPRNQVPGWGEVHVPIQPAATTVFAPGINFMSNSGTAGTNSHANGDKNYVNYASLNSRTFGAFSTLDLNTSNTAATYNAPFTYGPDAFGGMRFFTDARGLGRKGLELPPFYGVARLFAVYEAQDYKTNGSSVSASTRVSTGTGAKNLLRQTMPQSAGPTMWIEIDDDGDSTFILNANALDLSKSPNAIASFETAHYVLEVSLFGFDRGTFDLNSEARLVMTRPATDSWTTVGGVSVSNSTRAVNINRSVAGPTAVLPGPAPSTSNILVNYSRAVYQGDAWGSQNSYMDLGYTVGPIQTSDAYQIVSEPLDITNLTRPNQKVLEILAAVSFSTNAGTGRLSGDASTNPLDVRDVAYSDPTAYPPTSGSDPRPLFLAGNFTSTDVNSIGTEYLGCTERLPLGGLFRDADFRGQVFSGVPSALVFSDAVGAGPDTSLSVNHAEQDEVPLNASSGVGSAGDLLVHVDGSTNVSLLTNYRVTRGGSVFVGSGANPGGALTLQNESVQGSSTHTNVLQGRAFLVRNTVTNVGVTEVSAGDELMMLIVTTAQTAGTTPTAGTIMIGTAGAGEGYSAADLYRIDGHPLVKNRTRAAVDPSSIDLGKG